MKKFYVEMNGKKYEQRGNSAIEAFEKFSNRRVFGAKLIWKACLKSMSGDRSSYATYVVNDDGNGGVLVYIQPSAAGAPCHRTYPMNPDASGGGTVYARKHR